MAKLTVLAALLAALLAASAVSGRFTVTTTVVEDEASCRDQVREQDNFNMCHRFLQEQTQGGGSAEELEMVTGGRNPERGEHLRDCCRQMENVRAECRCEGLRMMMSQQRGQEQQQMEKMRRGAEKLPAMCNLSPRQCRFETVLF